MASTSAPARAIDSLAEVSNGEFKRTASVFRNMISRDSAEFPPESGRYILIVSYACPWACRTLAVRALKGLERAIDVFVVAPIWDATMPGKDDHRGWIFDPEQAEGCTRAPDVFPPGVVIRSVRDFYNAVAGEGATHKFTVPVLFDTKTRRIVNNESAEICRMLNAEFNAFASHPEVDLYPVPLRAEIDAVNDDVYDHVNNGVYRCGFATTQAAFDVAFTQLFDCLDRLESRLRARRFLVGTTLSEADVRLFVTLVRHDAVYVTHFKCNRRLLREYPALYAHTRDVYQTPGIAATVHMDHIKRHYFGSHIKLNPYGIVPPGVEDDFTIPHGRDELVWC